MNRKIQTEDKYFAFLVVSNEKMVEGSPNFPESKGSQNKEPTNSHNEDRFLE